MIPDYLGDFAAWAAVIVSIAAAGIAVWQGSNARRQARSAELQARTAVQQAEEARRAADAAETQAALMCSQLDQADRHRKEERVLQEVELAEELIYVTRQYAHAAHDFTLSVMLSEAMSSRDIKQADRELTLTSEKWERISGKLKFGNLFCLVQFEVDAFESEVTALTLARTQKYRSLGSDSPMLEELLPNLNISHASRNLEVSLAQAISAVREFVSEGGDVDIEDKISQAEAKIIEGGSLYSRAW